MFFSTDGAYFFLVLLHLKLETAHNLEITPVFITIDPQRDTPAQLQAYLKGQFLKYFAVFYSLSTLHCRSFI